MATIVEIREAEDPRDVVHRVVQLLSAGEVIVMPTETAYVAAISALSPDAVTKLSSVYSAEPAPPLTLSVKSAEETFDYLPELSRLGRKLTRRCWPGPVTFEFPTGNETSLLDNLPVETRQALLKDGRISVCAPANTIYGEISRLLPMPLLLSPERSPDGSVARRIEEVSDALAARAALMIDDGQCRYEEASTIVAVADKNWKILTPGIVTETVMARQASDFFLFVCTGNTCRSPMAEGMFRKFLAEKLECQEEELMDRGLLVASAGLSAANGAPASPESVQILQQLGVDLQAHESQPLTGRLLDLADRVFTMTRQHYDSILISRPDTADRVEVLARDGSDVSDPMGGGMDDYVKCQLEIERHLRAILASLEIN